MSHPFTEGTKVFVVRDLGFGQFTHHINVVEKSLKRDFLVAGSILRWRSVEDSSGGWTGILTGGGKYSNRRYVVLADDKVMLERIAQKNAKRNLEILRSQAIKSVEFATHEQLEQINKILNASNT